MADITSVTNLLATAQESFATTLASSITSGAATVPLTASSGYVDGDVVVLVVDPADAVKKQVFTGTVSGTDIINVVWTEGTDQDHSAGATVVDYVTASHYNMLVKKVKELDDINSTLACEFRVSLASGQTIDDATSTKIELDTAGYNYGGHFNTTTNTLTIPVDGIYTFIGHLRINGALSDVILDYRTNGGTAQPLARTRLGATSTSSLFTQGAADRFFNAGDTVEFYAYGDTTAATCEISTTGTVISGKLHRAL